jgi:hypothetical protein
MMSIDDLTHYGDLIAIPMFFVLIIYFYNKKNKNKLEYILFVFAIGGFISDILFSLDFLNII